MPDSPEVISLHVGEAGNHLGCSLWSLYCKEHGIEPDGAIPEDITIGTDDRRYASFFKENMKARWCPRAVFIDSDKESLDNMVRKLSRNTCISSPRVGGKEDAGSLFARGYHKVGDTLMYPTMDAIRRESEECNHLQGFLLYYSLGGGTGSGFSSLLRDDIRDTYPKQVMLEWGISPSSRVALSTVEPYNAALAIDKNLSSCNVTFLSENDALQDIAVKRIKIQQPSLEDLNKIASRVISSITAGVRFPSRINVDLQEMHRHLVPYSRTHFPLVSFSPFGNTDVRCSPTPLQMTEDCCQPYSRILTCEDSAEASLGFSLVYRGNIKTDEIKYCVKSLKDFRPWKFVDWSPLTSRAGLCSKMPPVSTLPDGSSSSVCLINNSSALSKHFRSISSKFDMLYSKRCFLHWYLEEGVEEMDLANARENLALIQLNYEAFGSPIGSKMFKSADLQCRA